MKRNLPITDIGSYMTVADKILAHWDDVNPELGETSATELKLEDLARSDFLAVRN